MAWRSKSVSLPKARSGISMSVPSWAAQFPIITWKCWATPSSKGTPVVSLHSNFWVAMDKNSMSTKTTARCIGTTRPYADSLRFTTLMQKWENLGFVKWILALSRYRCNPLRRRHGKAIPTECSMCMPSVKTSTIRSSILAKEPS